MFACLLLSQMLSHIREVHSGDEDFQITCGIANCEKSYNKYNSFYRHIKNHHHVFLEIPATDLNDVDISPALRFPSEQIDQETCLEEFQVHFCAVINACKVVHFDEYIFQFGVRKCDGWRWGWGMGQGSMLAGFF